MLPLNVVGNDTTMLQPHWEVCPDEKQFRAKPTAEKSAKAERPKESEKSKKVESGRLF